VALRARTEDPVEAEQDTGLAVQALEVLQSAGPAPPLIAASASGRDGSKHPGSVTRRRPSRGAAAGRPATTRAGRGRRAVGL